MQARQDAGTKDVLHSYYAYEGGDPRRLRQLAKPEQGMNTLMIA